MKYIMGIGAVILGLFWYSASYASNDEGQYSLSLLIRDGDIVIARPSVKINAGEDAQFEIYDGHGYAFDMYAKLLEGGDSANIGWDIEFRDPNNRAMPKIAMRERAAIAFNQEVMIVGGIPRNSLSQNRDYSVTMTLNKDIS